MCTNLFAFHSDFIIPIFINRGSEERKAVGVALAQGLNYWLVLGPSAPCYKAAGVARFLMSLSQAGSQIPRAADLHPGTVGTWGHREKESVLPPPERVPVTFSPLEELDRESFTRPKSYRAPEKGASSFRSGCCSKTLCLLSAYP